MSPRSACRNCERHWSCCCRIDHIADDNVDATEHATRNERAAATLPAKVEMDLTVISLGPTADRAVADAAGESEICTSGLLALSVPLLDDVACEGRQGLDHNAGADSHLAYQLLDAAGEVWRWGRRHLSCYLPWMPNPPALSVPLLLMPPVKVATFWNDNAAEVAGCT